MSSVRLDPANYWAYRFSPTSDQEDMMESEKPSPVGFDPAIENLVPDISLTDDVEVEIEDTPANDIRIATVATIFGVSQAKVRNAIVSEIESQLALPPPDKEMRDYLIRKEQEGFQNTND